MWQYVVTPMLEAVGSELVLTSFLTFLKLIFFLPIYLSVNTSLSNFVQEKERRSDIWKQEKGGLKDGM